MLSGHFLMAAPFFLVSAWGQAETSTHQRYHILKPQQLIVAGFPNQPLPKDTYMIAIKFTFVQAYVAILANTPSTKAAIIISLWL